MAATITFLGDDQNVWGNIPVRLGKFTADNSYPPGGYVISGANFGGAASGAPGADGTNVANNGIRGLVIVGSDTADAGYLAQYNMQTGKVQFFVMPAAATAGPLVEVTAATNLSTVVLYVLVLLAGE